MKNRVTFSIFKKNWKCTRCILEVHLINAYAIYSTSALRCNLVPRVFVPLDQRSEKESSGSNHFRRAPRVRHRCRLRSETGWAEFGYFKMVAPKALVFRALVKENENSGNEIDFGKITQSHIESVFLFPLLLFFCFSLIVSLHVFF